MATNALMQMCIDPSELCMAQLPSGQGRQDVTPHNQRKRKRQISKSTALGRQSHDDQNTSQQVDPGAASPRLTRNAAKEAYHATTSSSGGQILNEALENIVEEILLSASYRYIPMSTTSIKLVAQDVLRSSGRTAHNLAKDWCRSFRRRHPQVNEKWSDIASPGDSQPLQDVVLEYFARLHAVLRDKDISFNQIYNMHETYFQLGQHSAKEYIYVGREGALRTGSKPKSRPKTVTVVEVIRNDASDPSPLPGYMIFDRHQPRPPGKTDLKAVYTEADRHSKQAMINWLKFFIDRTAPNDPSQWRLLLMDGESPHRSMDLDKLAQQHKIVLFSMPRKATFLLQPLDLNTFFGLESDFVRTSTKQLKLKREQVRCPIEDLLGHYSTLRKMNMTSTAVMRAFRNCGIGENELDPNQVLQQTTTSPHQPFMQASPGVSLPSFSTAGPHQLEAGAAHIGTLQHVSPQALQISYAIPLQMSTAGCVRPNFESSQSSSFLEPSRESPPLQSGQDASSPEFFCSSSTQQPNQGPFKSSIVYSDRPQDHCLGPAELSCTQMSQTSRPICCQGFGSSQYASLSPPRSSRTHEDLDTLFFKDLSPDTSHSTSSRHSTPDYDIVAIKVAKEIIDLCTPTGTPEITSCPLVKQQASTLISDTFKLESGLNE
ncbi:unnamed protein product [Sympodiomycopsis kandeliae]